ncbi:MAG TPA: hypothetical protein VNL14_14775 [Candidatus Acidoferrales bacterium]|nr:hypothetical protein [Candidatus Acidoferrales bacterium]
MAPLAFLAGAFYSIDVLPLRRRAISLFNPAVYLISGFGWSFLRSSARWRNRERKTKCEVIDETLFQSQKPRRSRQMDA